MRLVARSLLIASAVTVAATVYAATLPIDIAPVTSPHEGSKIVELICRPGWSGGAVGQYGGVGFGVSCNNGRGRARIEGFTGGAYSVRVGVESSSIGADCFFTGDAPTVNETCIAVRLRIR